VGVEADRRACYAAPMASEQHRTEVEGARAARRDAPDTGDLEALTGAGVGGGTGGAATSAGRAEDLEPDPFGPPPPPDPSDLGLDPETDPLLADLTEPQRQAVLHTEGPLLILAAAGSGKTRVITRRIAHLVRMGIPPWQILALTFTNKAAGEMRERVVRLLGQTEDERPPRGMTITTFHSLCARLLRRYADVSGVPGLEADFTIYDSTDQRALMKQVIKGMNLSTSNWPPRSALSAVSNAKNEMKSSEEYEAEASDFYHRTLAKIYKSYERGLRRANAVDFDDLLLLTVRTLQRSEQARFEAQDRWRYLMIDEYQDTNRAQFALASLIAPDPDGGTTNICVVGDPDQSIYGWRGADIRNILEFEERYAAARVIPLGQNFRSTAPILAVADGLIRHNQQRKHKDLFTTAEGGEDVEVVLCQDEHHEARLVVDWLRARREEAEQRGEDAPWKDMGVFYRTNALSRVMEDELRRSEIPYIIARGTAFYDREEVKDALAYLRVVANPADDVSLRRIINKPTRGIGNTTISQVEDHAAAQGLTLWEALRALARGEAPRLSESLTSRAQNAIAKFVEMVEAWTGAGSFMGQTVSGSLPELVERVVNESSLAAHYKKKSAKAGADEAPDEDRVANLAELISSAQDFEDAYERESDPAQEAPRRRTRGVDASDAADEGGGATRSEAAGEGGASTPPLLAMLRAYLESVALVADADAVDPASGAVTLMTLHAAKGLEFPHVAIIGLEDGLLPHSRSRESLAGLEEERRLCFVGITRAMKRLLITSARYRTIAGRRERTIPSGFLTELPEEHVTVSDQSDAYADMDPWDDFPDAHGDFGDVSERLAAARANTTPAPGGDDLVQVGERVRHPQFGEGAVVSVTRAGPNTRAQIRFRRVGVKTLVLRFARLERLG